MVKLIRVVPILVLGLFVISTTVVAEVERIEITSRSVFADGMEYGAQVSEAAGRLVADRILLEEDGDAYVAAAAQLAWPPEPIDAFPFWELEPVAETVEMPVAVPVF
ncbi:MAG: hypothetical protein OEV48_19535 [Acidobacteriota bacterium]|jgi:hypothetical protein|nr:hypothetical protein [Acidobacteriota bacterium]